MNSVVEEIRAQLQPHPVPTLQQAERLMAEIGRLTQANANLESLRKMSNNEIELLKEEVARLTTALTQIATPSRGWDPPREFVTAEELASIAREATKKETT